MSNFGENEKSSGLPFGTLPLLDQLILLNHQLDEFKNKEKDLFWEEKEQQPLPLDQLVMMTRNVELFVNQNGNCKTAKLANARPPLKSAIGRKAKTRPVLHSLPVTSKENTDSNSVAPRRSVRLGLKRCLKIVPVVQLVRLENQHISEVLTNNSNAEDAKPDVKPLVPFAGLPKTLPIRMLPKEEGPNFLPDATLPSQLRSRTYYTCDICRAVFDNRHKLQWHISFHLSLVKCETCGLFLTNGDSLDSHIALTHAADNVKKGFACKLCGVTFELETQLKKHCTKRALLKYECQICKEKFPCRKLRDMHFEEEKKK